MMYGGEKIELQKKKKKKWNTKNVSECLHFFLFSSLHPTPAPLPPRCNFCLFFSNATPFFMGNVPFECPVRELKTKERRREIVRETRTLKKRN